MPSSMITFGHNMRLCPAACMFSHIALDSDIKEQLNSNQQLAERLRNYVFENSKETYSNNHQSTKEEKKQNDYLSTAFTYS